MKKLEDLTSDQFYALKKAGVLWEFYPDAPESYAEIKRKEKEPFIVLNRIKTPDGTILTSRGVHDYQTHIDKNGFEYMVDGGFEYLRRNDVPEAPYEDLSLFSDAPFEVLRKNIERGTRGKSGKEKFKWIPVCDMETDHLEACIKYNEEHGCGSSWMTDFYRKELEYRAVNFLNANGVTYKKEEVHRISCRANGATCKMCDEMDAINTKEKIKIPKGGTGETKRMNSFYSSSTIDFAGHCKNCGKPFVHIGDIPSNGWAKGAEPYCTCNLQQQLQSGIQGWICPKCGAGLSPYITICPCSGYKITWNTGGIGR